MRSYFPLTDYDFYAFVLTGAFALACLDYTFGGGAWLLMKDGWSIVYGAGVIASAYVIGLIASMMASNFLEALIVCRGLGPPREYLLGVRSDVSRIGGWLDTISANYNSSALPPAISARAIRNAADGLGVELVDFRNDPDRSEQVFQYGYAVGRTREDTCRRLDRDRREYEFSRNLSLVSILGGVAMLLFPPDAYAPWPGMIVVILGLLMFVRFFQYFKSFHTQVIREAAFAHLTR